MSIAKGQLISKAIYGLLTSPKKRTGEFVLFVFLLFMANKSNSSIPFLGESMAGQSAFRFFPTFIKVCFKFQKFLMAPPKYTSLTYEFKATQLPTPRPRDENRIRTDISMV